MAQPLICLTDNNSILSRRAWDGYLMNPDINKMGNLIALLVRCPKHFDEWIDANRLIQCSTENYSHFLSCKLTAIFASREFSMDVRHYSINVFHRLVFYHERKGTPLTYLNIAEYGKNLLSRPAANATPRFTFSLLSDSISCLASRMFSITFSSDWSDLRGYISSTLGVSFKNAVCIFQDLRVPLSDNFLLHLHIELNPPIMEALQKQSDDENWITAFGGAYAFTIQLMHSQSQSLADSFRLVMFKAVNSAAMLVNQGKESIVRRSLLQVQRYLLRHAHTYNKKAYDFTTEFIQIIKGINGVKNTHTKGTMSRMAIILENKRRTNHRGS